MWSHSWYCKSLLCSRTFYCCFFFVFVFLLVLCLYTDGLFTSKSPLSFASISFILCINIFYSLYQYIYSLYQYLLSFVFNLFYSLYQSLLSFVSISVILCINLCYPLYQSLLFIVSISFILWHHDIAEILLRLVLKHHSINL